ncbi:MAG: 4-hydroxy-tetrahydrodipicolinate reductase [Patescibacteria group bacterium]|nr:4-hydroxy-tetrahydrodipicolinate reductase [Patescibacteria group bacterium]
MKIALIGYGNMGQEVENVIKAVGKHKIVSISYKNISDPLDKNGIKKADVAIDFTAPDVILKNIKEVSKLGVNMVIGTTGWYEKLKDVEKIVIQSKTGLIYGQNFSIGANIFFKIVAYGSTLFNKFGNYDVYGMEIHHKGKKDSPSGTAKKLADVIMKNFTKKNILQTARLDRKIEPNEFHFASVRGGVNPGFHQIIFDSLADEIRLEHIAHGRRGFAEGAIMAAEFIKGKKGVFSFDELFK